MQNKTERTDRTERTERTELTGLIGKKVVVWMRGNNTDRGIFGYVGTLASILDRAELTADLRDVRKIATEWPGGQADLITLRSVEAAREIITVGSIRLLTERTSIYGEKPATTARAE